MEFEKRDNDTDLDNWWIFDVVWWIKIAVAVLVIILCFVI